MLLPYPAQPAIVQENEDKYMATLNGVTPEQLAKQIVKDAVEPSMIVIDGVCSQNLDVLVRKAHRDEIDARGENHWKRNRDRFRQEFITDTINKAHKQLIKYISAREEAMNLVYYKSLIAHGHTADEAHKLAFNGKDVVVEQAK